MGAEPQDAARGGVGIVGVGSYLPQETAPNSAVAARASTTEEWILRKTGVRSRHYAAPDEATSDLAVVAARRALAAAGVRADRLSWILVATSTPDHPQPATACLVQHRLGAVRAAAFDLNAVCAGFVFATVTAHRLLLGTPSGEPGFALVIGADTFSRIIDRDDRRTSVLFGDGAGAVVLGPVRPGTGIIDAELVTQGSGYDLIQVPAGGSRLPTSEKTVAEGRHFFQMDGRAVRDFVSAELPPVLQRLLASAGLDAQCVDHFIPHQANSTMLQEIFPTLGLNRARLHLTVAEHGNTSAASIPLALDAARRRGLIKDEQVLLLAGFGGGMSIGACLVRWDASAGRRPAGRHPIEGVPEHAPNLV